MSLSSLFLISRGTARLHRPDSHSRRSARLSALIGAGALLWLPLAVARPCAGRGVAPARPDCRGWPEPWPTIRWRLKATCAMSSKLLLANTPRTTLFADGDANHATVLYDDDLHAICQWANRF